MKNKPNKAARKPHLADYYAAQIVAARVKHKEAIRAKRQWHKRKMAKLYAARAKYEAACNDANVKYSVMCWIYVAERDAVDAKCSAACAPHQAAYDAATAKYRVSCAPHNAARRAANKKYLAACAPHSAKCDAAFATARAKYYAVRNAKYNATPNR